jgi:response regulator RpfG family c-di-GMP phosphodiesterase
MVNPEEPWMIVSSQLFEAYIECATKCWLRSRAEPAAGNVWRIKADPALRSIPIIAVSSYALSGDEEKARVAGCNDFVSKPFSPRQLLAKVRQYLS